MDKKFITELNHSTLPLNSNMWQSDQTDRCLWLLPGLLPTPERGCRSGCHHIIFAHKVTLCDSQELEEVKDTESGIQLMTRHAMLQSMCSYQAISVHFGPNLASTGYRSYPERGAILMCNITVVVYLNSSWPGIAYMRHEKQPSLP